MKSWYITQVTKPLRVLSFPPSLASCYKVKSASWLYESMRTEFSNAFVLQRECARAFALPAMSRPTELCCYLDDVTTAAIAATTNALHPILTNVRRREGVRERERDTWKLCCFVGSKNFLHVISALCCWQLPWNRCRVLRRYMQYRSLSPSRQSLLLSLPVYYLLSYCYCNHHNSFFLSIWLEINCVVTWW